MHLSLERLVTTVVLLFLAMSVAPHLFFATSSVSPQLDYGSVGGVLSTIMRLWAIDIIAISLSVDYVSLSLSVIPFACILPVALVICVVNHEAFMSVVGLALLTIVFVIARYIANLM